MVFVFSATPTADVATRAASAALLAISRMLADISSVAVATVPVAWWFGWLSIHWLYFVAFLIGIVNTAAGSAAQIVLTQIVPRARLVEAHAKNALANSAAEVTGPGAAGALILLLLWVYYSVQILLLGAEFTKAYAHVFGSRKGNPSLRSKVVKV